MFNLVHFSTSINKRALCEFQSNIIQRMSTSEEKEQKERERERERGKINKNAYSLHTHCSAYSTSTGTSYRSMSSTLRDRLFTRARTKNQTRLHEQSMPYSFMEIFFVYRRAQTSVPFVLSAVEILERQTLDSQKKEKKFGLNRHRTSPTAQRKYKKYANLKFYLKNAITFCELRL